MIRIGATVNEGLPAFQESSSGLPARSPEAYIYMHSRVMKGEGLLCIHSELFYKLQSLAARHAMLIANFLAVSTRNAFCS